jgi:hypothetical protein
MGERSLGEGHVVSKWLLFVCGKKRHAFTHSFEGGGSIIGGSCES